MITERYKYGTLLTSRHDFSRFSVKLSSECGRVKLFLPYILFCLGQGCLLAGFVGKQKLQARSLIAHAKELIDIRSAHPYIKIKIHGF